MGVIRAAEVSPDVKWLRLLLAGRVAQYTNAQLDRIVAHCGDRDLAATALTINASWLKAAAGPREAA